MEILYSRLNQTTAVCPRAFNGLFKKDCCIDYDHEILVCGETRCEQLKIVAEGMFPEKIHKVLRSMSFSRPMRLQGYVWPAVSNGLNVVAVNSPKSGKTYSYLVPIVGSIATNEIYPKVPGCSLMFVYYSISSICVLQIPGVNGPLALILCESSLDVYRVHEYCVNLLKEYSSIKVIAAYSGIQEKSLTVIYVIDLTSLSYLIFLRIASNVALLVKELRENNFLIILKYRRAFTTVMKF